MQIDIAPETERLVREEILSGHFHSADEVIRAGVAALREKHGPAAPAVHPEPPLRGMTLHEFFMHSPLRGANLDLERAQDYPRTVDLE